STAYQSAFSVSSNGVLAYAGPTVRSGRLNWYDRGGKLLRSEGVPGEDPDFRISPDEKRLAGSLADPQTANPDIWFNDLVRGGRLSVHSSTLVSSGLRMARTSYSGRFPKECLRWHARAPRAAAMRKPSYPPTCNAPWASRSRL